MIKRDDIHAADPRRAPVVELEPLTLSLLRSNDISRRCASRKENVGFSETLYLIYIEIVRVITDGANTLNFMGVGATPLLLRVLVPAPTSLLLEVQQKSC
jgi:hypothetical protein